MISLMFRIALICGSLITAGYMVKKSDSLNYR